MVTQRSAMYFAMAVGANAGRVRQRSVQESRQQRQREQPVAGELKPRYELRNHGEIKRLASIEQ